jgi:hypothetical protein
LALHPMDTKAARNPTTDTFQAKHYCSSLFAHLKTTFSVSTNYLLVYFYNPKAIDN